jgi:poly-gamma-glutamate synthesis protein (capsule biosynthesis protein)
MTINMDPFLKTFKIFLLCLLFSAGRAFAEAPPGRVRALFVGDIMAHKEQLDAARRGGSWDFAPQFRRVKPLFNRAFVVGNLETVFAGGDTLNGFTGYPLFNTPDELATALVALGVDAVTIANNNILDKGATAASRTIYVLNED